MKLTTNSLIAVVVLSPVVASAQYTVTVDADNDYALYTGTSTAATTFYGNQYNFLAGQLQVAQSYNVTLSGANNYIYIAAWSDLATAQGLLADISSTSSGNLLLGSGSIAAGQWQVAATGKTIPANAPPPDVYFSDPGLVMQSPPQTVPPTPPADGSRPRITPPSTTGAGRRLSLNQWPSRHRRTANRPQFRMDVVPNPRHWRRQFSLRPGHE